MVRCGLGSAQDNCANWPDLTHESIGISGEGKEKKNLIEEARERNVCFPNNCDACICPGSSWLSTQGHTNGWLPSLPVDGNQTDERDLCTQVDTAGFCHVIIRDSGRVSTRLLDTMIIDLQL